MTDKDFQELRDNRAAMIEFFASKGWEIFFKWISAQVAKDFELAIRETDPIKREQARCSGLAKEEIARIPFFLMEQADTVSAEQAPTNP